ncbi:MAG: sulfatase family protein [Myxococcota bacterium]
MRAAPLLVLLLALGACDSATPPPRASQPPQENAVLARVGSPHRPASVRPPRTAKTKKLGIHTRNAVPAATPFEVEVPEGATRLAFSLACEGGPGAHCEGFRIEQRAADDSAWHALFEGAARHDPEAEGGWTDHALDLPAGPGRSLRFSAGEPRGGTALWGSPLLLGPAEQARPNVVLISLDTLGALSLGSFSGRAGVSPRIDALLDASADFRHAYAQYGNTLVSHASLFSALHPVRHGIYPDAMPGPLESSLVGALADAGYRTVAFTEGAFVSAAFGFAAGYDAYDDGKVGLSEQMSGGAERTFQRAGDWLRDEAGGGPFFLFVHSYEVHTPYLPRDEQALAVASRVTPGDSRWFAPALQTRKVFNQNTGREPLPQRDLDRMLALHTAEVHTLDRVVGAFVDRLDASGAAPHTLLVLTADHGDQFGEWGKLGHGESLHDRVLHVPLAFRWPGVVEPRRIEGPVQLVDVMPTVLDLVRLPPAPDRDGVSLAPALRGDGAPARPAFAEQRTARGECLKLGLEEGCRLDRVSIHSGRWKLVSSLLPPGRELYDLEADPQAQSDVAALHPQVADRLEAQVRDYRGKVGTGAQEAPATLDADTLQRLRDLGYVGPPEAGSPSPPKGF